MRQQALVFHSTVPASFTTRLMTRFAFVVSLTTMALTVLAVLVAAPLPARAEYRAYQLLITDTRTNQSRLMISTLDDIQYPDYHHLRRDEIVSIQATWMCWGRTDPFKPICRNPYEVPTQNKDLELGTTPK